MSPLAFICFRFSLLRLLDRKKQQSERSETPVYGAGHARFVVVIVFACLLVAGMGSLALVILELREAPEGYEDERGFHVTSGSMMQNTRRPRSFVALKSKPILAGFL